MLFYGIIDIIRIIVPERQKARRYKLVKIVGVLPHSRAEKAGILAGDVLISINENEIYDVLDYRFYLTETNITLSLLRDGETYEKKMRKEEYDDIGLEFETPLMDKKHSCRNKCVFCFIDQLPKGMRDTLYFKDDDWRMSYIMGNYVTLSNVGEAEFQRILRRKTPLYISVHATDEDVRRQILNSKNAAILPRLKQLAEHKITFNSQAVLAAGVNDGAILEKTISDLMKLHPYAASLALVPVGITAHREGLYPLHVMTREEARAIISIAERWQKVCLEKLGTRFVFCSDELYMRAELPLPPVEEYEELEQKEDGVGLVSSFFDEAEHALEDCDDPSAFRHVSIACGTDIAPLMQEFTRKCEEKLGMRIDVFPIKNDFFGHSITISGLMTGRDIIAQLKDKDLGERLFFTKSAMKEFESVFLDGITLSEICDILNVTAVPVPVDGWCFIDALSGLEVNYD